MIVQNIVFPNDVCDETMLYFRTEQKIHLAQDEIQMGKDTTINTFTYMNLFDSSFWKEHTDIKEWMAKVQVKGTGIVKLYRRSPGGEELVSSVEVNSNEYQEHSFEFTSGNEEEIIYFEFASKKEMAIKGGCFYATKKIHFREVHLSVVICTYRRNQELCYILDTLKATDFFVQNSSLYGKMTVRVVDNASELLDDSHSFITVYHNPNTGGAGGFTRGIVETRSDEEKYGITNVVLMDDDVKVIPETFYRLYTLLALLKEKYQQEVVAGRMFRLDDRKIQYTAAEIWNKGEIQHIGFQRNMCDMESLEKINDSNSAEYSGWWFACFPMEFVRMNTPLPFFLHCDDVEYGLRHGGTPIILNGIQVWHETFEYRQSPMMAYYDTRNPLIVNYVRKLCDKQELMDMWIKKTVVYRFNNDYVSEYMAIYAINDFIKGVSWLKTVDSVKLHNKLDKKSKKKRISIVNRLFRKVSKLYATYVLKNI